MSTTPAAEAPPPLQPMPSWGTRARAFWKLIRTVLVGYRGEDLDLRAGNLTFISITSLVPLGAVIFSLLHTFNANRIDPLVQNFFQDILSPGGHAQSEETIQTFLSAANSRTAGGLSFVVVLISAGLMLRHLDAALNGIWQVTKRRPAWLSVLVYAGVLIMVPLLIALSLMGTQGAKRFMGWIEVPFSAQLYVLGSILAAVTVFTMLYKGAPHAPVRWRSALSGGIGAGLAWEMARHLYGSIASFFFSANKVYGSLGIAPLFLMWIYVSWYIVLSGSRLAYAVEHLDFHGEFQSILELSRRNELIASRIAEEVARAALQQSEAPTSRTLAFQLRLPEQRVRELVHVLVSHELLRVEQGRLYPARDVKTLTLADISVAVGGTSVGLPGARASGNGYFEGVARFFSSADATTIEKLKTISWADLVQDTGSKDEAKALLGTPPSGSSS